jgi:hypothetical protein
MWPHTMNFTIGKINKNKNIQQCRIWKYFGILKIWRQVVGNEVDENTLALMCVVDW